MIATLGVAARKATQAAGVAVIAISLSLGFATGLAHADETAVRGMYGDPVAAIAFWQPQTYDDCVLMAAADVVGEATGRRVSEQEIIALAQQTPSQTHPGSIYTMPKNKDDPNTGQGTSYNDIPLLLSHYGVAATVIDKNDAGVPTGMAALKQYLGAGRKVIVALNAELLAGQPEDPKDPGPNHAVVATGVDTVNGAVHLNDSGVDDGADKIVSIELFTKAWATGDDELVVTGARR
ncbi:Papain-like cysteine protease AvrRpt2 [Mycobacterium rhizamassiliense]|uniref:Papain-like cysteine protease AvrRpt2 n=1 Tax=Mycobacterium rhizamassiliense TaxID=1841860 RepID=A0A2U3NR51_9MYCO|nr:C39 family peptidase [Mycobacterium rhizamassiliense]SPM33964.1 Papain-like cysteine protease AvrRpt2 [Mycobacterium rhizamassiliense]